MSVPPSAVTPRMLASTRFIDAPGVTRCIAKTGRGALSKPTMPNSSSFEETNSAVCRAALFAIVILGMPSPPAVSAMLPERSSTSSTAR